MGGSDLKVRTKEYALRERWDGRLLPGRNGLNGAKRLNVWNDLNGLHSEQGIFVRIVINTKAKSKPPKS